MLKNLIYRIRFGKNKNHDHIVMDLLLQHIKMEAIPVSNLDTLFAMLKKSIPELNDDDAQIHRCLNHLVDQRYLMQDEIPLTAWVTYLGAEKLTKGGFTGDIKDYYYDKFRIRLSLGISLLSFALSLLTFVYLRTKS